MILRQDYNGIEAVGRYGTTTDGGFEQQQYSAITGSRWDSGGLFVSADYLQWTAIRARQRSFASSFSPSDPILPSQEQFSAVAAGHQMISSALEFGIDAQYNHRTSPNAYSNNPPNDYLADGQLIDRRLEEYSVSPSLRLTVGSNWNFTASSMYSRSTTHIFNQAFYASSEYQSTSIKYDNSAASAELGVEGSAVRLPAGAIRIAAGIGYRSNTLDLANQIQVGGASQSSDAFKAVQRVFFAYGEALVPLFGPDNKRPGLETLNLTAAVRYESYNSGYDVTTPKLGLVYSPIPGVAIKGSWGKSFKAPTLNQQYQATNIALLTGAAIQG